MTDDRPRRPTAVLLAWRRVWCCLGAAGAVVGVTSCVAHCDHALLVRLTDHPAGLHRPAARVELACPVVYLCEAVTVSADEVTCNGKTLARRVQP